jgi:hypothetical protein
MVGLLLIRSIHQKMENNSIPKKWEITQYKNWEITQYIWYQKIGDNSIPIKWEITQYQKNGG